MKNNSKKSKPTSRSNRPIDPLAGDLSDLFNEGGWGLAQFELREKKDQVLSLRLSRRLLSELKKRAEAMGLDTQKFVRLVLENNIRKKAG